MWLGLMAHVAEAPRKSVGQGFELGRWSFFFCVTFLLSSVCRQVFTMFPPAHKEPRHYIRQLFSIGWNVNITLSALHPRTMHHPNLYLIQTCRPYYLIGLSWYTTIKTTLILATYVLSPQQYNIQYTGKYKHVTYRYLQALGWDKHLLVNTGVTVISTLHITWVMFSVYLHVHSYVYCENKN